MLGQVSDTGAGLPATREQCVAGPGPTTAVRVRVTHGPAAAVAPALVTLHTNSAHAARLLLGQLRGCPPHLVDMAGASVGSLAMPWTEACTM